MITTKARGRVGGLRGATGIGSPGGNIIAVGTRNQLGTITVPAGTQLIQTTGDTALGDGPWEWVESPDQSSGPSDYRRADQSGRYFDKLDQIITAFGPVGTADGAVLGIDPRQGRLIMSSWDDAPQNDTMGYFAGAVAYLGRQPNPRDNALNSIVGGRNCYVLVGGHGGALGHDCLNVATAAFIGGAGGVVGNPFDIVGNLTTKSGYGSFGWVKNGEILGQTAAGFGELIKSNSRGAFSVTYQAQVETTATLGGMALGPYIRVRDGGGADFFDTNGPQAGLGAWIDIARPGIAVGYGANAGSRLGVSIDGAVELGAGGVAGALVIKKATPADSNISRAYSRTGWRFMGDNGATKNLEFGGILATLDNSTGPRTTLQFQNVTGGVVTTVLTMRDDYLRPFTTNTVSLGGASNVFTNLFVTNAPTVGSDKRLKEQEGAIPDAWLDAWSECEWLRYKLRASVAEKGDAARWHLGLIAADPEDDTNARTVAKIFERHGVDGCSIGLLCYDKWDEETEPVMKPVKRKSTSEEWIDSEIVSVKGVPLKKRIVKTHYHEELVPDGKKRRVVREAGDQWSIRYEQALVLDAALARRERAREREEREKLAETVSVLEQRLAALEAA